MRFKLPQQQSLNQSATAKLVRKPYISIKESNQDYTKLTGKQVEEIERQIKANETAYQKIWDAAKVSFQETKSQKDLVETMKQLNVLDSITQNLRLSLMLNGIFKEEKGLK